MNQEEKITFDNGRKKVYRSQLQGIDSAISCEDSTLIAQVPLIDI